MPNQTPLNPDALEAGARALLAVQQPEVSADYAWNVQFDGGREELRNEAAAAVSAYLAAALPEVTSVEELNQLPAGTVARDSSGFVFEQITLDRRIKPQWVTTGSKYPVVIECIDFPVRVLYRPEVKP